MADVTSQQIAALSARISALESAMPGMSQQISALRASKPAAPTTAASASSSTLSTFSYHPLDGNAKLTNSTGISGAWTTWVVPGAPAGSKFVQLECWAYQDGPDSVNYLSFLLVRANAAAAQFVACGGRSAGSDDGDGGAMQGIYPLNSDGTIQYNASTDFGGWQIRVVGYWGS